MPTMTTQQELEQLIESSLSIASLDDENKSKLKARLLGLPEKEMQQIIKALRREQEEQFEKMKGLVDQIEEASKNLKKTFLKEREKDEKKDSEAQADEMMKNLDEINP